MPSLSPKRVVCPIVTAIVLAAAAGADATPVTPQPDLVSVTLDPANVQGARQAAAYCFDLPLNGVYVPARFRATGYDANRFLEGRTAAAGIDPACVVVTFDAAIDLRTQGSVGTVDAGAVTDLGGRPNTFSGAPLTGSSLAQVPGQTTGPDLLSAEGRAEDHTVEYTFDQPVDRLAGAIDVSSFGVAGASGDVTMATGLVEVDATNAKVRVSFPESAPTTDAAGFFVARGAVRTGEYDGLTGGAPANAYAPTTRFTPSPPAALAGRAGSRPVLTAARPATQGDAQFVVEYASEPGAFDPARVVAVRDNGEVEPAASAERVPGAAGKRILTFPADGAVDRDPDGVVAIVSQAGATPAPPSAVPVGPGADSVPGRTNGPDLVAATLDPTTSQAAFVYDEPIDPARIGLPERFQLLGPEGPPVVGIAQGVTASDRRTVLIGFPGSITDGVGVATGTAATEDSVGNRQEAAVVPTTAVTSAAAANPVPVLTRVAVRRARGSRTVTGTVRAKAPCRRRRVRVLQGTRLIEAVRSRRSGRYTIRLERALSGRLRARVAAKTVVEGGVSYRCSAATSGRGGRDRRG